MFTYQIINHSIRILACRSHDDRIQIPENIDNMPVTELAPYAFSEGGGYGSNYGTLTEDSALLADFDGSPLGPCGTFLGELPPRVCGSRLKEIYLPSGIYKIGNYAFYNCFNFEAIHCCSTIADLGSGLFTGCTGVRHIDIQIVDGRRSCLKEMLSELRQELYVKYNSSKGLAKLVFPEMYEESVENTPARIIMREMHGCGHRYRYAFDRTEFQFHKYDGLFPHVQVQEPEQLAVTLVMGRLQYPLGLYEQYKKEYEAYLRQHLTGAVKAVFADYDYDSLTWLAERYGDSAERLDEMMEQADYFQQAEAISYLMDLRHHRFPPVRRSFSL